MCSMRCGPARSHLKLGERPHGSHGSKAWLPVLDPGKCSAAATAGPSFLPNLWHHPISGNLCNCRADTVIRDTLVGDISQDWQAAGMPLQASPTLTNPPSARTQFRKETSKMTVHFQTAQFGTSPLQNVTRSCSLTSAAAVSPGMPPPGQRALKELSMVTSPAPSSVDIAADYCQRKFLRV